MYMLELLEVLAKERKVKCGERDERRGQDPGKDEIHTGEESMKRELERLKRERELKVEAERCFIQVGHPSDHIEMTSTIVNRKMLGKV